MDLEEKAITAKNLKIQYQNAYNSNDNDKGAKLEKEYLILRKELLDEIDAEIKKRKSITATTLRELISKQEKPIPIETGISRLDRELVTQEDYNKGKSGGFPMGNFINVAGLPGAGKTSMFMKIITGFSIGSKVAWFNFEMSDAQVIDKLDEFSTKNEDNILYYNSSRELSDIVDEIKVLYAEGIRHFSIDSVMKIKNMRLDGVQLYETISSTLKDLTSMLDINIYLINQLNQSDAKNNILALKWGNSAEYDSDMILFVIRPKKLDDSNNPILDDAGQAVYDETKRYIKCHKNRIYHRLFMVEIAREDIYGIEVSYENFDMPIL